MRRRSKKRRARPQQHEEIELTTGTLQRDGRFLTWHSSDDRDAVDGAVAAYLAQVPAIGWRREERRRRLLQILATCGAAEVVAFASLVYLRMDPNTFKEWESDRLTSHIEYLALQSLAVTASQPTSDMHPLEVSALAAEAVQIVRDLFQDQVTLVNAERINRRNDDDKAREYSLRAQLESMAVRGSAYQEHHERVLVGCLTPFDDDCLRILGFTVRDALMLPQAVHEIVDGSRLAARAKKAAEWRALMLRTLRRARANPSEYPMTPPGLLTGSLAEAKRNVERFSWLYLYHDAESLLTITALELSDQTKIPVARCEALLSAFACDPEQFDERVHAFPSGGHPVTQQPLLRSGSGFLLPVPSSFVESIRPRVEDLLRPHNALWQRYLRHRARWVEAEACRIFGGALRGSRQWTNLKWKSRDRRGELDGLVACDDFTLRIQAKAGRISTAARRGAPDRMRKQVGDLVRVGGEQHAALAAALDETPPSDLGFDRAQADALAAPIQIEVIVCLDEVTIWSTETHELVEIGMIAPDRPVPWVLSLTDLMATADLLRDGPLIHYITRRQRLEADGRISAHDELDWLGNYLHDGLFFDSYFADGDVPTKFQLLSFTESIDSWYFARAGVRTVETSKPAVPLPIGLATLIERLSSEQPKHWTVACLALLDGDLVSWEVWERSLQRVPVRLRREGWTNTSMIYRKRYGVTLFIDYRVITPSSMFDYLAAYCKQKAERESEGMWIGVGEAATGGLVVTFRYVPPPTLREIFMKPVQPGPHEVVDEGSS